MCYNGFYMFIVYWDMGTYIAIVSWCWCQFTSEFISMLQYFETTNRDALQ